jgi:hypothetical protein
MVRAATEQGVQIFSNTSIVPTIKQHDVSKCPYDYTEEMVVAAMLPLPAWEDRDMVYLENLEGDLQFSIPNENDGLTLWGLIEPQLCLIDC